MCDRIDAPFRDPRSTRVWREIRRDMRVPPSAWGAAAGLAERILALPVTSYRTRSAGILSSETLTRRRCGDTVVVGAQAAADLHSHRGTVLRRSFPANLTNSPLGGDHGAAFPRRYRCISRSVWRPRRDRR